jgi:hypothetical protein
LDCRDYVAAVDVEMMMMIVDIAVDDEMKSRNYFLHHQHQMMMMIDWTRKTAAVAAPVEAAVLAHVGFPKSSFYDYYHFHHH